MREVEKLSSPEIPRSEYYPNVLAIYGKPGTGQSAIAEELARRTGFKLYRAGQERRSEVRKETGEEIIGHYHTDVKDDLNIDNEVTRELLEASPTNKTIIDAKLSNVILREEQERAQGIRLEFPDSIGILFVARGDVRYSRIREREIKKAMKKTGISRDELEKDPKFSKKAIKKATIERETGDKAGWDLNHPQIIGIDIFNTSNKDARGQRIHDLHINTTKISIEEAADLVEEKLKKIYEERQRKLRRNGNHIAQNGPILQDL